MKGAPFCAKVVYKRVKDWTGAEHPEGNFVEYPPSSIEITIKICFTPFTARNDAFCKI